jgi:acyl carrier protein
LNWGPALIIQRSKLALCYIPGVSRQEFLNELSEILEQPAGSLQGTERLEDMEGWGSMAMVSLIALADEKFGKSLSPRQIAGSETVADLERLVGL